ncbi:MAG: 3-hydroxyacyl-CoA dehydrogenase family protein [Gammaproteobacteria bacterium]|nr:3-hydroxyacyl-CoA dehydrogenase family protein [Gammaproteobacteria bacterium]
MNIKSVGIVGAGTMGTGIAINVAQSGFSVYLTDLSEAALERAVTAARTFFGRAAEKGRITQEQADQATARISTGTDLAPLAGCDLVIEAVFEDLDIKLDTFRKLNGVVRKDTILTTNTSCLKVSDIAQVIDDPGRFLGTHYFSPAQINPLVEVIRGDDTREEVVDSVLDFCAKTGKKSLLCRDQNGFAVNRFFCPYTNEAVRCVDEGLATPGQVDVVAQSVLGVAFGPFAVMNIIKPQVNLHAIRHLESLGPYYQAATSMVRVGDAGESWKLEEDNGTPPEEAASRVGERLLGSTFLTVLQALDEEVAEPKAFDMGAEMALRFGNPPCRTMDAMGRGEVERLLRPLCESYGTPLPNSLARVGSLVS